MKLMGLIKFVSAVSEEKTFMKNDNNFIRKIDKI